MACLVKVTLKTLEKDGGSRILSSFAVPMHQYKEIKNSLPETSKNFVDLDFNDNLHRIYNHHAMIQPDYLNDFLKKENLFDEIVKAGNPSEKSGWTLAHYMAVSGKIFTVDEIIDLGNPITTNGQTIAHLMAKSGHVFSLDEILKLGNAADINGQTIAHFVASPMNNKSKNPDVFTFDEIIQLGNPKNNLNETVAHLMADNGHIFSIDELIQLGNPSRFVMEDFFDGTIAHAMADNGYIFSFDELMKLRTLPSFRPEEVQTLWISMKRKKKHYSSEELKLLGID